MRNSLSASDKSAALQALRDKGVARVTIEFSGGNDEGGADAATFFDADGKTVDLPNTIHAYQHEPWVAETKSFGPAVWMVSERSASGHYESRPATDEEVAQAKIVTVLEAPIYDRWGSFAGEFSVYGTVEWNVETGQHRIEGQESHEVYDGFKSDWS